MTFCRLGFRSIVATSLFLTLSCASAAKKTKPPELTSIPSAVVEAVCGRMRHEGVASNATLHIVKKAQPQLITGASLRSLAHAYFRDGEMGGVAQALGATVQPVDVEYTTARTCSWTPVDKVDPVRHAQLTVVELSPPFVNPFSRSEAGIFVRMSIGDRDAQWYWIPLAERNGVLAIGLVMPLDLHNA